MDFSVKMSGGSLSTPYYSLSEGQETDNTLYDFAIKFRQTTYSYGDFGTEYLIIGLGSESGKFLRFIIAGITTGWSSMSEAPLSGYESDGTYGLVSSKGPLSVGEKIYIAVENPDGTTNYAKLWITSLASFGVSFVYSYQGVPNVRRLQ